MSSFRPMSCRIPTSSGVIGRSTRRDVNFRLVPTSLEAIIGKTRIDDLDPLPLVEIEYNIHRPANRAVKRTVDVVVSCAASGDPSSGAVPSWIDGIAAEGRDARCISFRRSARSLPGRMSFVGRAAPAGPTMDRLPDGWSVSRAPRADRSCPGEPACGPPGG